VNQVVSALNLKVTPLPQEESKEGTAEQIVSGGLQITFTLPSLPNPHLNCTSLPAQLAQLGVLCTLPDVLQGLNATLTVGRVTTTAKASPPFDISALADNGSGVPSVGAATQGTPGGGGPLDLGAPSAALAGGGTSSPAAAGSLPNERIAVAPISLSSPIGIGLLLTVLALAVGSGFGLRRLTGALGAPPASACPLEDTP
jgi:hypothetical protein